MNAPRAVSAPLDRRGKALTLAAGLGCIAAFLLGACGWGPRLFWQALGFAFGCVCLWLLVRHVWVCYRYEVDDTVDGGTYLFVSSVTGRKVTELARLPLEALREVTYFPAGAERPHVPYPVHRFHAQLFPGALTRVHFFSEGENILLEIEAPEDFALALSRLIPTPESRDE